MTERNKKCFSYRVQKSVLYTQGWCTGKTQRDGMVGEGGGSEGKSEWGTQITPWLIHVNVWQKPLQCCKVISLQLIKINEKKNVSPFSAAHSWVRQWWQMESDGKWFHSFYLNLSRPRPKCYVQRRTVCGRHPRVSSGIRPRACGFFSWFHYMGNVFPWQDTQLTKPKFPLLLKKKKKTTQFSQKYWEN